MSLGWDSDGKSCGFFKNLVKMNRVDRISVMWLGRVITYWQSKRRLVSWGNHHSAVFCVEEDKEEEKGYAFSFSDSSVQWDEWIVTNEYSPGSAVSNHHHGSTLSLSWFIYPVDRFPLELRDLTDHGFHHPSRKIICLTGPEEEEPPNRYTYDVVSLKSYSWGSSLISNLAMLDKRCGGDHHITLVYACV